jgi:hypothetical protein
MVTNSGKQFEYNDNNNIRELGGSEQSSMESTWKMEEASKTIAGVYFFWQSAWHLETLGELQLPNDLPSWPYDRH